MWTNFCVVVLRPGSLRKPDGERFPGGDCSGRTNMRYPYPEAGGISQPQRASGQPLPFTTGKHTGSGIEPGFPNCEAHAFPRRHYTLPDVWIEKFRGISFHPTTFSLVSQSIHIPQMDKDFTPKELEAAIHKLKKGKATGWDLIPNEIIKNTPNPLNL